MVVKNSMALMFQGNGKVWGMRGILYQGVELIRHQSWTNLKKCQWE